MSLWEPTKTRVEARVRVDQGVDPSLGRKDCRGLGPPNASIIRMFRAKS